MYRHIPLDGGALGKLVLPYKVIRRAGCEDLHVVSCARQALGGRAAQ